MRESTPAWTDERADRVIGILLRTGLFASVAVVLSGAVFYLFQHAEEVPQYAVFRGEPPDLRTISGIVHGALALRPRRVMQLGLLLLIATPVLRVAFSIFAFAAQRDWTYVAITLSVLTILLWSIAGHV